MTIVALFREWCGSLGGDGVAGGSMVLPLPLVVELVTFGFRGKKRKGLRSLAYVATAYYQGNSSRSSKEINDGEYNGMFMLLSLKKRDR